MRVISPLIRSASIAVLSAILIMFMDPMGVSANDKDLVTAENDTLAIFMNGFPVLTNTEMTARLEYFAEEICSRKVSKSCETFEISCSAEKEKSYELQLFGASLSFVNFTGAITSGYELPHILYLDRLIKRHRDKLTGSPTFDLQKSKRIVNFHFKKGENLPDFGESSYRIQWDTRSENEADELSEMLTSGETVLISYPVRLRKLMYTKLHPKAKTDQSDVANDFVVTCSKLWERQE